MSKTADGSNLRRIVAAFAFSVAAFALRILSWPLVFGADGVRPAGGDAYYHLRRITYTIENFPATLTRDPYLNHPHGGEVIWSPAFDWMLGALGWVFVGPGDAAAVERAMVWVPPLLGAACVGWLYWIVARHFSTTSAAVAAVLASVLPAHVFYSRLGAIDHHVAAALCALWILSAGLRLFECEPGRGRPGPPWGRVLWLAAAMASALLIWPGTLIHVAALQVALAVRLLTIVDRACAVSWAWRVAAAQLVAALVVLPFSWGREWEVWGAFNPVVLSSFQPVYLAAAACGFAGLAIVWDRLAHAESGVGRLAQSLFVGAIVAGAALSVLPGLGSAALDAWGWFSKDEEFQAVVAESAPLLWRGSGLELARAELLLSRGLYLTPFAIFWLAWSTRDRAGASRRALVAWLAAIFLLATLLQRRFMNTFSLFEAIVLALACEQLFAIARARLHSAALRAGVAVLASLLAAWALWPVSGWYGNDVANLARLSRGEAARPVGTDLVQATLLPVAHWLRDNTPETRGFHDASLEPEYSLLSAWGDGHLLTYVARRPQLQGNFGDDVGAAGFETAEQFFRSVRERDAVALLARAGVRYVVVGRTGSGHSSGYAPNSLWARMYPPVREARRARDAEGPNTLSLVSQRLVHTSEPAPPDAPRYPYYAVYERVAGASVVGQAPPGAHVEARLKLLTREDGELRFTTEGIAGADGRYRLQLPYANRGGAGTLRVGQAYRISSGDREALLVVRDEDVLSGATLDGPDFSGGR